MKIYFSILLCCLIVCSGCDDGDPSLAKKPETIVLNGRKNDTTYLYCDYKDPGAVFIEDDDGIPQCSDRFAAVNVSGAVNTRLPGAYVLKYEAVNSGGRPLSPATRTVHVVENKAGFLNGSYDAVCSCTALVAGSSSPGLAIETYTANVTTGSVNRSFALDMLKIGPESVMHNTTLDGDIIYVSFFSPDFDMNSVATGTLAPGGNAFTIESTAYRFAPKITYHCKNVYTRRLITMKNN
ncbi:MAG: immunoglobulin-like domain-containing protein [Bacteroidota bacterium]